MHELVLFNRLLQRQRYWSYALGLAILFLIMPAIFRFSFDGLSEWLFRDYFFVALYSGYEVFAFTLIYLLAGTLLTISESWFRQQKRLVQLAQLEEQSKKAEIKILRAQINPHFLFNSLNIIYHEAKNKTKAAPALILKLSEMLRYVVDKLDQEKVSLAEEVIYLSNFVDFHKERLNQPEKVQFTATGNFGSHTIIPLVLITFVENSFKHANMNAENSFIDIRMELEGRLFSFSCTNSFEEENSTEHGGTGMANARRRLELAYQDRQNLEIIKNNGMFEVNLNLQL